MGAQLRRNTQAYSQLLFGREREGGASLREAASLAIPLQMVLLPHVRGGSVSRRDHNLLTRNRAHLAWGRKLEEKDKPIPSYSSGERGLGGEALLLEKRPLPPESPSQLTVFPAQGRGGSVSRRDHNLLTRKRAHLAWGRKLGGKDKPIPSYSSGGSAREGLLLEKPPPSQSPLK